MATMRPSWMPTSARTPRCAGAVDDGATLDDEVEHADRCRSGPRRRWRPAWVLTPRQIVALAGIRTRGETHRGNQRQGGQRWERTWKVLIGGELVDGAKGTYSIVNPATEGVVAEAPEASVPQAEEAAHAAQEAFPAWSRTPVAERARLLTAVTDKLIELQDDLVPLIIAETGATAAVGSRMQVPVAIERFKRYSRRRGEGPRDRAPAVAGAEHAARAGARSWAPT